MLRTFRISIASLMGVVLVAALGFAALRVGWMTHTPILYKGRDASYTEIIS